MAFTTWNALRTEILDAIAEHIAGKPFVKEFTVGEKTMRFTSLKELEKFYARTFVLERIADNATESKARFSYGCYRSPS